MDYLPTGSVVAKHSARNVLILAWAINGAARCFISISSLAGVILGFGWVYVLEQVVICWPGL
jgi:hypothetical protein